MTKLILPKITWCKKCVYPSSSAIPLCFNEDGICSGCLVGTEKHEIDWDERLEWLIELVEPYRRSTGPECVIGVSGGKDSYWQTHYVIEKLNLKPVLVTYNGNNYLDVGWRNLMRMRKVFNCDHHIFQPSVDVLIRLNRLAFRRMGDMNWQNHAGIATIPMKFAVEQNIPLVFWGEHGFTELGGMHSHNDMVEWTKRHRLDQLQRGYDWHDMLNDSEEPIEEKELSWLKYPEDSEINRVGLRGIYLDMYSRWDVKAQVELIKDKYGWEEAAEPFERTYRTISNLDDRYENGAHDYLKWIKFGYGRATDHATKDIREGLMTREEGVEMVRKYDHVKSSDIHYWLNYVDRTEEWFDTIADTFRSTKVWVRDDNGSWHKMNIWDK